MKILGTILIMIGGYLVINGLLGIACFNNKTNILKAEIAYSDKFIWQKCRKEFVDKEDFEEWKRSRREIAEHQKR